MRVKMRLMHFWMGLGLEGGKRPVVDDVVSFVHMDALVM